MSNPDRDSSADARQPTLLGMLSVPVIVYDPQVAGKQIHNECRTIAAALGRGAIAAFAVQTDDLAALFVTLPQDQITALKGGRPVVIWPIKREDVNDRAAHRPSDTARLAEAKVGQAAETFRLLEVYTAAELAEQRGRVKSRAEAEQLAMVALGKAAAQTKAERDPLVAYRIIEGLVDRCRRIAARYFGTVKPKDRLRRDALLATESISAIEIATDPDGLKRSTLVESIKMGVRERVADLAAHVRRAATYDRAMAAWSASAREGAAIAPADARDLCNAHIGRMSAHDLMRLAIATGTNPADTHRNLSTMRELFELGRKLGRLHRGTAILMTAPEAAALQSAIATVRAGRLVTQADGCAYYLADAAGAIAPASFWDATLASICEAGVPLELRPENMPAEKI